MLWDVLVVVVMVASLALYLRGVPRVHAARWEAPAFVLGWLTLLAALLASIDALIIVAVPLLILGRPIAAILCGLPERGRDLAAELVRRRLLLTLWRRITGPPIVLVLHAGLLLAGAQPPIVFAASALFWWGLVHGRYGRVG